MSDVFTLSSGDGNESIIVVPCPCGDCNNITLLVERRKGRKRRKVEITLCPHSATFLQDMLEKAKMFHAAKDAEDSSPELN